MSHTSSSSSGSSISLFFSKSNNKLLKTISKFLVVNSICSFISTCKNFKDVVNDDIDSYWRYQCRRFGLSSKILNIYWNNPSLVSYKEIYRYQVCARRRIGSHSTIIQPSQIRSLSDYIFTLEVLPKSESESAKNNNKIDNSIKGRRIYILHAGTTGELSDDNGIYFEFSSTDDLKEVASILQGRITTVKIIIVATDIKTGNIIYLYQGGIDKTERDYIDGDYLYYSFYFDSWDCLALRQHPIHCEEPLWTDVSMDVMTNIVTDVVMNVSYLNGNDGRVVIDSVDEFCIRLCGCDNDDSSVIATSAFFLKVLNQAFCHLERLLTYPLSSSKISVNLQNPIVSRKTNYNPREFITYYFHPITKKRNSLNGKLSRKFITDYFPPITKKRRSLDGTLLLGKFDSVPEKMVEIVFSYLSINVIGNVMSVCKTWSDKVIKFNCFKDLYVGQYSNKNITEYYDVLKSRKSTTSYMEIYRNQVCARRRIGNHSVNKNIIQHSHIRSLYEDYIFTLEILPESESGITKNHSKIDNSIKGRRIYVLDANTSYFENESIQKGREKFNPWIQFEFSSTDDLKEVSSILQDDIDNEDMRLKYRIVATDINTGNMLNLFENEIEVDDFSDLTWRADLDKYVHLKFFGRWDCLAFIQHPSNCDYCLDTNLSVLVQMKDGNRDDGALVIDYISKFFIELRPYDWEYDDGSDATKLSDFLLFLNQAFCHLERLLTSPLSNSKMSVNLRNPIVSRKTNYNPRELITDYFPPLDCTLLLGKFDSVPEKMVEIVFSYLPINVIGNVMSVCKTWKDTVVKSNYFKDLYLGQYSNKNITKYYDVLKARKNTASYMEICRQQYLASEDVFQRFRWAPGDGNVNGSESTNGDDYERKPMIEMDRPKKIAYNLPSFNNLLFTFETNGFSYTGKCIDISDDSDDKFLLFSITDNENDKLYQYTNVDVYVTEIYTGTCVELSSAKLVDTDYKLYSDDGESYYRHTGLIHIPNRYDCIHRDQLSIYTTRSGNIKMHIERVNVHDDKGYDCYFDEVLSLIYDQMILV